MDQKVHKVLQAQMDLSGQLDLSVILEDKDRADLQDLQGP